MKIVVIGGGISGMFSSYYLLRDGHEVTIVDKDTDEDRTSIYNAGLITPSFSASPTQLSKLIAAAIWPQGPLYISLREVMRNVRWFRIGVAKGLSGYGNTILLLGKKSFELYDEFFSRERVDVDLIKGVVALFNTAEHARKTAEIVNGKLVEGREIEEMGFRGFGGGVLLDEYSINPLKLYAALQGRLSEMGAKFVRGGRAKLRTDDHKVRMVEVGGKCIEGDAFVVAAGAGSRAMCKELGYDPQILPARGLVMIFDTGGSRIVTRPAFFEDQGISLSQHDANTFRMTSYFELVGFRRDFSRSRKNYIIENARAHIIHFEKLRLVSEGVGFRPCTPDQLPVIGRIPGYGNAWIASGGCREGIILGPITGHIIASMISGRALRDVPVKEIDPRRFSQ